MGTTQMIANTETPPRMGPLGTPLLDGRQRWQDFGMMAADLLFETDLAGQVTFLAPDYVLALPGHFRAYRRATIC